MKIAYLATGAAGMYCGTCLHDNTLAAALRAGGDDALLLPTYTPLRTDEDNVSEPEVHFGGLNLYLQEKIPLFRHTPAFVDRWLDSPRLLDWLSKFSSSVQAEKLGGLATSVLRGEEGKLRKEVLKLAHWLATDVRPQIVHLSNALLIGVAREIKAACRVPIVSTLSGEDNFLDRLTPRYRAMAQEIMRERAQDIDAYVALNGYYADAMADYLAVDRSRIHVISHGLKLAGHGTRSAKTSADPFTVGYLARVSPEKGLHVLVEAFRLLAADASTRPVRLEVAGYLGAADRRYLADLESQLAGWGLKDRYAYRGELTREAKIAYLQSLDVMSLPTVYRESKGLSVLEALANAVPVALPAHGTFPELIADTAGGVLHQPADVADLARALRQLRDQPDHAAQLGQQGQQAIRARYSDTIMAQRHHALYERLLNAQPVKKD